MGVIEKTIEKDGELTVFVAVGEVSADEIGRAIRKFYSEGPVTRNVLWDLSRARVEDITRDDIRRIIGAPEKSHEGRRGGRTAIVAPDDLAFGLSRMYQASLGEAFLVFQLRVFRETAAARRWLDGLDNGDRHERKMADR
ncbi:MAG: hypothetical protein Kow0089_05970 [Desulfobulbaceae bacterium]